MLYDLRDKNDRMMLGFQAVQAEWVADSIRDNVLRGIVGAAEAGRPHGEVTQRVRAVLRRADAGVPAAGGRHRGPDRDRGGRVGDRVHQGRDRPGGGLLRVAGAGDPLIVIEQDFNTRGVPASQGGVWRRGIVRKIAMNPAYIGKRVLRGEVIGDGCWSGLVDEETYWACVRLLEDPARTTWRPARAHYLLSYLVRCGKCGGPLSLNHVNRRGWSGQVYSCLDRRCCAVKMQFLDEYVERTVVAWLSRPEVFDLLSAGTADEDISRARAEAQRLRAELEDWRKLAETGDVTAISFARAEKGLLHQITQHEQAAAEAGVPPVLRGRIGPEAVKAWAALGEDVAVKREIIRTIAQIKLLPVGKGTQPQPFGAHRLDWTWRRSRPCVASERPSGAGMCGGPKAIQ